MWGPTLRWWTGVVGRIPKSIVASNDRKEFGGVPVLEIELKQPRRKFMW